MRLPLSLKALIKNIDTPDDSEATDGAGDRAAGGGGGSLYEAASPVAGGSNTPPGVEYPDAAVAYLDAAVSYPDAEDMPDPEICPPRSCSVGRRMP